MKYWLLKTEPDDYSFEELQAEGTAVWDGVKNNQALMFLREIEKGDEGFIYHTGKQKAIVGTFTVKRSSYPDPEKDDEKLVVIDIKAKQSLAKPISLKAIKEDDAFSEFLLVRNSRLSVMPVPLPLWKKLQSMGT
ncbi:MAG: EVE domain-containing protein [Phycisphaerae bacterium]